MTPIPLAPTREVSHVLWQRGGRVIGGEPIVSAPDGSVSWGIKPFGEGQVVAFANSHIFERKTMGYTAMLPNPTQNTISQFEYHLMTYLNYPPADESAVDDSSPADTTSGATGEI